MNRCGVVFHHDNEKPHVFLVVRMKLLEFDWDVLPHPPYSPYLAPSDYYLFLSLKNFLRYRNFKSVNKMKNGLEEYFKSKPIIQYDQHEGNIIGTLRNSACNAFNRNTRFFNQHRSRFNTLQLSFQ